MIHNIIYFDNNATTRVHDEVLKAMLPYFSEHYGNAASKLHAYGWTAAAAIDKARQQLAELVHCEPEEIIFTSGATESVNLALKGIAQAYRTKGNHIITSKTEHKAVMDTCAFLEKNGYEITWLNVDREGRIDMQELAESVRETTIAVSIMSANNETGVIQPVQEIAELCETKKIIFFSDATQSIGKERFDLRELGVHCMAFSAHKMYGPKGVGALYVSRKNPRVTVREQIHGGGHQEGKRSGTLNVPGIVGFGAAAEVAARSYWDQSAHVSKLRSYFEHQLLDIEGLRINGSTRYRLFNTSNICFPDGKAVAALNSKYAFSSGSACSSGQTEPSHVLKAMGMSEQEIRNSYRFSFGIYNTMDEVRSLVQAIAALNER